MSWREQYICHYDEDEVRFLLDMHAYIDCYRTSSLKQQFGNKHVAPLEHIIQIPSQSVFVLSL
jgi:hypothetical protein